MNKIYNLYNQKKQKNTRKSLRNKMPEAEVILWSYLKNKQLKFKFRRQQSIDKYIVDFYCPELKLVIEIDGDTHYYDGQRTQKDKIRQKFLEDLNLKVKRYNNIEVKNNPVGVINDIHQYCQDLAKNNG